MSAGAVVIRAGDRRTFAIEAEILTVRASFVFGAFFFWANGVRIGNPGDTAVVNGCRNWLNDFGGGEPILPEFVGHPLPEIFGFLSQTIYGDLLAVDSHSIVARKGEPYGRFFVTHVGMSSFDSYRMIALDDGGAERLMWWSFEHRNLSEAAFPSGTMKRVARQFVERFDVAVPPERYRR